MLIGVLALQGDFREHINILKKLKVRPIEVRTKDQLKDINGLIIPGGESTTILKLLKKSGLDNEIKKLKIPIYGTCAGAILLSKKVLNPEYKTKPRAYYMNIPGKFIAGTVYDPVEKVIVKGATCTLTESGNGKKKLKAVTDGFGDFWFEGLKVGKFSLKIEAKGFKTKTFDVISTEKDVNLGDIPL